MAVEQDTASVCKMLRQRQKEMFAQKEEHLKQINQLSEELQRLFAKAPKKPRGSIKELDDEINALEFKRTTSSLPLAQEKGILRQIDSLTRAKSQCADRQKHEQTIQDKKAELGALRDSLTLILASIDELAPVLAKVELADKLKCSTLDLKTITLDCPQHKTRHVIGRSGANIKQIMERTSVVIDVDSEKGEIVITGSESALDLATKEIRRITEAVEEDIQVPSALVGYLTTRRLNAFSEFRDQHPAVFIDVSRNSTTIRLEGLAEDVAEAKDVLFALDVKQESRALTSIEASVVVGKRGVNINKLVDDHKVAIDVESADDSYTVSVIGPSAMVDAAMASINELLELNKDVTELVAIDSIVRTVLLNNGGVGIKKLQKDINAKLDANDGSIFISVDKTGQGDSSLLIKGRRTALVVALEALDVAIKEIKDSVVTIQIDPFIAPRLIGKGGANIKKMKNQGDGVIIDIDKAGKVELYGSKEDMAVVTQTIQIAIDENHLTRIDCDPKSIKPMFRALIREKNKEINATVSGCDLDEETSQIVLRGSLEQIKTVSDMIDEFMANNYIEEVKYSADDEDALFMGGSGCVVNKMAQELDVSLQRRSNNLVIVARGEKEKVSAAVKRLDQFLNGGDGHSVSKLVVSEQAVGVVIGKGGSRRMELEEKHDGVKIFIERTNGLITIRGPDQSVQDCRKEILKIVSSVRVQDSIPITPQQYTELSKPEVVRRLTTGIPVGVTVTESEVSVRGIYTDVRDALALLKFHLTGEYETHIELDASQYSKISASCRDPSHFNRMKESTSAQIDLDPSSSSIVIRGKRGNVKKAKVLVMGFLDFLLPSNFAHIKMPKAFQSSVASAASLTDVAVMSGASVVLDRDLNSVQVQSSDPEKVKEATVLIKAKMTEAEKLVYVLSIEQSEAWLVPAIIGKGGQRINAMSKETNCRIDVSKQELVVTVSGEDEESVIKAKAALAAAIDKARRECVFVQLPSNSLSNFIGKSGAHIKRFSEEHGVEVERVRKEPSKIKITGNDISVAAAKKALLEWIKAWEEANAEVSLPVDKSMIPAILGKDGSVISAIQKDSGCRVDIDRSASMIAVRGGTLETRNAAVDKITAIIAEEQTMKDEREQKKEKAAEERAEKAKVAKNENPQPAATGTIEAKPSEDSLDARKDRTAEFAPRPVGMTPQAKAKKGSSKNAWGRKDSNGNEDAPLVGTAAGRNLFGLLVSNSSLDADNTTLRSEDNEMSIDSSSNGDQPVEEGPVYVRSSSGFAVRV